MAASTKPTRSLRKRRNSSESSDEDCHENIPSERCLLSDIKELQRLRSRQHGVSAESLAEGKALRKEQRTTNNDPLKMKTGGIVDMKALKKQKLTDEDGEAIGTAFAAETNRRDEDTEMLKYVEVELSKRKGKLQEDDQPKKHERKNSDDMYVVPDNLATKSGHKHKEDMISSQMLSGIPEVDLGIETKILNIEKTEEAKHVLMMERLCKKDDGGSEFIPTNMAVNFMQHNRFNVEDMGVSKKKKNEPAPKVEPLRVGDAEKLQSSKGVGGKRVTEKATDDDHYNKFRSKMKY